MNPMFQPIREAEARGINGGVSDGGCIPPTWPTPYEPPPPFPYPAGFLQP